MAFYTGALAFIHTNRTIRAESLDTLATHMLAHIARLEAEVRNCFDNNATLRMVIERRQGLGIDLEAVQTLLTILKEVEKGFEKLRNSATQVKYICWTMG